MGGGRTGERDRAFGEIRGGKADGRARERNASVTLDGKAYVLSIKCYARERPDERAEARERADGRAGARGDCGSSCHAVSSGIALLYKDVGIIQDDHTVTILYLAFSTWQAVSNSAAAKYKNAKFVIWRAGGNEKVSAPNSSYEFHYFGL